MQTQFMDLAAAADFLGPGAIEVNRYQSEITDIVRRRGVFGQRIKQVPATGHPSRFFEEIDILVSPLRMRSSIPATSRPWSRRLRAWSAAFRLRRWSRKSTTTSLTSRWA